MRRLIVLRGNSGSGKTTVAKALQERFGRSTMLLSQDTLRREILRAPENSNHSVGDLLWILAQFGWSHGYETVITEGIWWSQKNGTALKKLINDADESYVYYFDVPFEETLRRHKTKHNSHEFGEKEMKEWWLDSDVLGVDGEQSIVADMRSKEIVDHIAKQIDDVRKTRNGVE